MYLNQSAKILSERDNELNRKLQCLSNDEKDETYYNQDIVSIIAIKLKIFDRHQTVFVI